jgi:hypothetical protein
MGEDEKQGFQLSFNRLLRVSFQGSRITSDGGLILVRELDEPLGCGKLIEQHLNSHWGRQNFFTCPLGLGACLSNHFSCYRLWCCSSITTTTCAFDSGFWNTRTRS